MPHDRPNFLILLADDMGYGDLGCYGADDLRTPNLDGLATSGARFGQWYGGSPVCSASRAALLTGQWPWQVGVPGNVPAGQKPGGLAPDAPTLPETLRRLGYQTRMAGKWHLGQAPGQRPHERGFDDWFGFLHGCVDYYSHIFYWCMSDGKQPPRHDLWHNTEELFLEGQYVTDLIADAAIEHLRQVAEDGRPFFLYVPFNAPHYPMHAPPRFFEPFDHLDEARRLTAGLMASFDDAAGRILAELDRQGLREQTCVLASSDHGPSRETRNWPDGRDAPYTGGSTGGLRGQKFSLFEGGIRVPALLRWPGVTEAGRVVDAPASHHDVFPSFVRAAGGENLLGHTVGHDLHDTLATQDAPAERTLRWRYARRAAVRRGPWKLIRSEQEDGDADLPFLANLDDDPTEAHNLADKHPDIVEALAQEDRQAQPTH